MFLAKEDKWPAPESGMLATRPLIRPMTSPVANPSQHTNYRNVRNESKDDSRQGEFYFKMVAREGPRLISIYDGETEYRLGVILRQPVAPNFGGGFFVYKTMEEALQAKLPTNSANFVAPRCVLKCLAWGESINYGDRLCFECLRPVQVIPIPLGYRNTKFSGRKLATISMTALRRRMPQFRAPNSKIGISFSRDSFLVALQRGMTEMDSRLTELTDRELGRIRYKGQRRHGDHLNMSEEEFQATAGWSMRRGRQWRQKTRLYSRGVDLDILNQNNQKKKRSSHSTSRASSRRGSRRAQSRGGWTAGM